MERGSDAFFSWVTYTMENGTVVKARRIIEVKAAFSSRLRESYSAIVVGTFRPC